MPPQEHPFSHPAHPSGSLRAWKPRPLSSLLPYILPDPPPNPLPRDRTLLFIPSISKLTVHPAESHVLHRALLANDYHILATNHFLPDVHPLHNNWPQIVGWHFEIEDGDETLAPAEFIDRHRPSMSTPFAPLPPRVDKIHIVLNIRRPRHRTPHASSTTQQQPFSVPSDLCIPIRNQNGWNALEDTPPILTRNAAIEPEELALLLEHTLFDTDHGTGEQRASGMYRYDLAFQTAFDNFRTYARHLARRTLLGDTAAATETIAELASRYVGWAIPPGHRLNLTADPRPGAGGFNVELEPA